ncbi:FecR family protein [Trinickia mobilis]|uniref:FecR family protein n=1 Tax=Trinickia mobilis TaxID=2816356 RepID=UPI001A8EA317|nr:FecR family protein [Trinickia mobilis]
MKTPTPSPRLTLRRLTGYVLLAAAPFALASHAAFAQTEPPQGVPPQTAPAAQQVDPPSRVARLNYMAGAVTTEPAGATDWSYATLNRPLTTGDQLWNDANARSELHIGSTAVRLSAATSLDVLNLDDANAQLKVAQGTLSTHVRELAPGSSYEIDTPNVAVGVTGPGDYRVDVAPDGSTTTVTVRDGSVTVYGDGGQVPMSAGQQITFSGTNLQQVASNGAPPPDAFDQWAENRNAAENRSISARYVSRDIPGYEDLDANGTWSNDPQYGAVWEPNSVPQGWAPYHEGHWVWQAPWGWTWVDDAPWGFAPYHYGRWAYVDDRWAWVPGPLVVSAPPVYAPALVAFVGGGGGGVDWGVDLTIGGVAAAGVAWFPLGPGEVWHPSWGGWSPRYYERVNQTAIVNRNVNITNINNIHNTYINYRAPGAVTAVPATAFVHGQPVMRFAQKVDPQQWRNARISAGAPGIAPVRQSFGPGLRQATYRPPQAAAARQIVATRSPVVPAAFHDQLAQRFAHGGGQVRGAGEPVVRSAPPAGFAAQQAHGAPARDVRLVNLHSPVMAPMHGPAQVEQRPAPGAPGAPGAPNAPRPEFGQAAPHTPMAVEHGQPGNGVPRPPQMTGNANGPQHAPGPMAQQRGEPGAVPGREAQPQVPHPEARAPQGGEPRQEARMPQGPQAPQGGQPRQEARVPQAPQAPQGGQPHPEFQQREAQQPRAEPQPRPEQHVGQAPQARPEPRSQPQPQPQVRAEPRPQPQPQPQAHAEPRPQPQPQPQARAEPRPQPQPQAHAEPRPQPQPQPQPRPEQHVEQHSGGGGHDEHKHE